MNFYVLDTSALVTLFENRPGAEKVGRLVQAAAESEELMMSAVNWGELYYTVWLGRGQKIAEETLGRVERLRVKVVDVDKPTAKLAGRLKAEHKLPYADSFAAALAQRGGATLVTGDQDFVRVAKWVNILWVNS